MAKVKKTGTTRKIRPAMTPEARENQMIALAMDAAERQLLDGSASSQVITHFLKLGTERERLERENELLRAKTEAIESGEEMKSLYEEAIKAMRNYAGQGDADEY